MHFAFRTNDDDVEWKTHSPASRKQGVFAFQKETLGREPEKGGRGGGGEAPADVSRTPDSTARDQINIPNESRVITANTANRPGFT